MAIADGVADDHRLLLISERDREIVVEDEVIAVGQNCIAIAADDFCVQQAVLEEEGFALEDARGVVLVDIEDVRADELSELEDVDLENLTVKLNLKMFLYYFIIKKTVKFLLKFLKFLTVFII